MRELENSTTKLDDATLWGLPHPHAIVEDGGKRERKL